MIRQPTLRPIPGLNKYRLVTDYAVDVMGHRITVPAGFNYDGASIPSIGWLATYTPFHPDVMAPALVHDWLYSNHQVQKAEADLIFRELLLGNGVEPEVANIMHWAVGTYWGDRAWLDTPENVRDMQELYQACKYRAALSNYCFPDWAMEA